MRKSHCFDRRTIIKTGMALPLATITAPFVSRTVAQGADKPFKFVTLASLTGSGTSFGTGMAAAVRRSIEKINAGGGVLGRPMESVEVDTSTDAAKALLLLQDIVSRDRPVAVFQAGSTAEALSEAPLAVREKLPFLTVADLPALDDVAKFPYVFSTQTAFIGYATVYANTLKAAGVKSACLMTALDGTGEMNTEGMPRALKAANIELRGLERFKVADVDMTSQLRTLEQANPDVLLIEATGAPSGYILNGVIRLGITRPIVVGKSMAGVNLETLVDLSKLPPVYTFNHAISHRGPGGRGDSPLVKAEMPYFEKYSGGKLTTALYLYAWGYDAPLIWAAAATRIKGADGEKIVAEWENWSANPPTNVEFMTRQSYPYTRQSHLPPAAESGYTLGRLGTLDASGTRESVAFKL